MFKVNRRPSGTFIVNFEHILHLVLVFLLLTLNMSLQAGRACCYECYILFFMVFYGIIMDDFMVYYTQYVNPIFFEKLHKFLLLSLLSGG